MLGPEGGNRFEPASITVLAGTTVTWHWPVGSLQHNVVGDNGTTPDGSGALADGEHTYSFTFSTLGTYRFYCANHGGVNGSIDQVMKQRDEGLKRAVTRIPVGA